MDLRKMMEPVTAPPMEDNLTKCRSLVCDSSGIIIAEMIYRCMVCYYVSDSMPSAKQHYEQEHMKEDDDLDPDDMDMEDSYPASRSQMGRTPSTSSSLLGQSHKRQSTPSSSSTSSLMNHFAQSLKHAASAFGQQQHHHHHNQQQQQSQHMTRNGHRSSGHGQSFGSMGSPNDRYIKEEDEDEGTLDYVHSPNLSHANHHIPQIGSFKPSRMSPLDGANGNGPTPSSNTKSGYVTCAVCQVTRFYSCVQRRYGQFTCVTCYRYFRTFLLKPKRYACPKLGQCPLNVRTRCRACWIKGCISVFSVDAKRKEVIEANLPVRKITPGMNILDDNNNNNMEEEDDDEEIPMKALLPPLNPMSNFSNGHSSDSDEKLENSSMQMMLEPEVSLLEEEDDEGDDRDSTGDFSSLDTLNNNNHSLTNMNLIMSGKGNGSGMGTMVPPIPKLNISLTRSHTQNNNNNNNNSNHGSKNDPSNGGGNKLIATAKKVWSCGKCQTCTAEDCGKCIYCLDRPKFGGPFIKKQRCIKRRCLMKIKNKNTATLLRQK